MIENSQKSFIPGSIKKSRKKYYLITDAGKEIGICTKMETAYACMSVLIKEKKAKKVNNDIYSYEDEYGQQLIVLKLVKRLSLGDSEK